MSKKFLITATVLTLGLVIYGSYALGKHNSPNSQKEDTSTIKIIRSRKSQTDNSSSLEQKNNQNKSTDQPKSTTFNALPQKTKLALLAYQELPTDYGTGFTTHYTVYMGDKNKIVIVDDGEGAGGIAEHSVMFTDNHDGTYTVSDIESTADSIAAYNADNSYWHVYKTISETEMLKNYQQHTDEINFSSNTLIDLSKSAQSFTFVPTNQTSQKN